MKAEKKEASSAEKVERSHCGRMSMSADAGAAAAGGLTGMCWAGGGRLWLSGTTGAALERRGRAVKTRKISRSKSRKSERGRGGACRGGQRCIGLQRRAREGWRRRRRAARLAETDGRIGPKRSGLWRLMLGAGRSAGKGDARSVDAKLLAAVCEALAVGLQG